MVTKFIIAFLTAIGICCILQFVVVGLINVIRGYSIGTRLPHIILLVGVAILVVLLYKCRKKPSIANFYSLTVSFALIYSSSISISQGRYIRKAEKYYDKGQYRQALQESKKEAQTWYHLLRYNYNERVAMNMIAKTHCQLGDFDSARNTYNLMIDRYSGEFYSGHAKESLLRLEEGLKIVAYYPEQVPETSGFPVDLYDIARTYRYDLNCHTKAHEVYTKILDMDIPEEWKKLAKEQIVNLIVAANRNRRY